MIIYNYFLEMDSANVDSQWLKEAIQRCFIYLGDIGKLPYCVHVHVQLVIIVMMHLWLIIGWFLWSISLIHFNLLLFKLLMSQCTVLIVSVCLSVCLLVVVIVFLQLIISSLCIIIGTIILSIVASLSVANTFILALVCRIGKGEGGKGKGGEGQWVLFTVRQSVILVASVSRYKLMVHLLVLPSSCLS